MLGKGYATKGGLSQRQEPDSGDGCWLVFEKVKGKLGRSDILQANVGVFVIGMVEEKGKCDTVLIQRLCD